jgi:DNA-binding XRE family transcriptional regulator
MLYMYNTLYSSLYRFGKSKEAERISEVKMYNRLAVLRAERGLSRLHLANAVGVNKQTIGYLERGEYSPSLDLAFRISEFFGLPIEAIFSPRPFKLLSQEVYPGSVATSEKGEEHATH